MSSKPVSEILKEWKDLIKVDQKAFLLFVEGLGYIKVTEVNQVIDKDNKELTVIFKYNWDEIKT